MRWLVVVVGAVIAAALVARRLAGEPTLADQYEDALYDPYSWHTQTDPVTGERWTYTGQSAAIPMAHPFEKRIVT